MFNLGIWKFTKIGKAFSFLDRRLGKMETPQKLAYNRKNIMTKENEAKAYDLFLQGVGCKAIAEQLGYGRSTVQRALKRQRDAAKAKVVAEAEKKAVASDPLLNKGSPIRFDPRVKYDSAIFGNGTKQAAYERLIRAIEKRGGMAVVNFPHHDLTRQGFQKSVNATLWNVAKVLKVKTSCRLAGNGLNELLIEVK